MKYLRLENDSCQNDDPILFIWNKLPKENNEFKIIERAYIQDKSVIYNAFMWADEIWFQTTFIRQDELYNMALLLAKIEPRTIKVYNLSHNTILYNVECLLKDKEAAPLNKHNVYEIKRLEKAVKIDLSIFQQRINDKEKLKKDYFNGLLPTGRKVIIGNIKANNSEFSLLKEGDIVDEIDNFEQDPSPGRGIWVKGKTEAVKLLNEHKFGEFTFETNTAMALAVEFYSFKGEEVNPDMLELLMWRINNSKYEIEHNNLTLWDFCDEICSFIDIERRFHRSFFEKKLLKYHEKYQYWAEHDRIKHKI